MLIARKTYGWGKSQDGISVSQIADATKLGRSTVIAALNILEKAGGPIICIPSSLPKGHHRAWNSYRLNTKWEGQLDRERDVSSPDSGPVQKSDPSKNRTRLVQILDPSSPDSGRERGPESGPTRNTVPRDTNQETLTKTQGESTGAPTSGLGEYKTRRSRPEPEYSLPEDWQPTQELLQWASDAHPEVDITGETFLFCNHFVPKPSIKRAGWSRSWKTWIFRASKDIAEKRERNNANTTNRRTTQNMGRGQTSGGTTSGHAGTGGISDTISVWESGVERVGYRRTENQGGAENGSVYGSSADRLDL